MIATYNPNKPPKRNIPKNRIKKGTHYTMRFPTDLLPGKVGLSYQPLLDCWLEDCMKRIYKHGSDSLIYSDESGISSLCLN